MGKEKTGREALVPAWGRESTWKASAHLWESQGWRYHHPLLPEERWPFRRECSSAHLEPVMSDIAKLVWGLVTVTGRKRTRILPTIPSSCASTSITALSVSCADARRRQHGGTSRELPRTYNFKQHIASSKAVALPFLPRRDSSLCHGRGHCGHLKLCNGTVNGCCAEPWCQQVRNGLDRKVHVMAHIFVTDARQT